jgi:tRNA G10  N-methylase Trm11
MQSLLILGRQPSIGIAEIESLYGSEKITMVSKQAVIVDVDPCLLAFDRLGGSVKFCKLLTKLPSTDWPSIEKFLIEVSPKQVVAMPPGKMKLGISAYGFKISAKSILASGLSLKKAIQETGRSVRLIPNKDTVLNSAQVSHNKLTGPTGWELDIIKSANETVIAQTIKVQDIDAYAIRDRERPKRDSRVGMLPPKLAQIIINLAVGKLAEDQLKSICDIAAEDDIPLPDLGQTILDPFSGTGVLVQEALIMGYRTYASDLEPKMIDYTEQNIDWLIKRQPFYKNKTVYEVSDAIKAKWNGNYNFVASELYLGSPLTSMPDNASLSRNIKNCNTIITKFLSNIATQIESGTRLCLAIPAWQIRPDQFSTLPLIDQIKDLGYNRVSFNHVSNDDLIYYRSNQIVARQLLVITRI